MKRATVILAVCGLASAVSAQSLQLSLLSRVEGQETWSRDVYASPGSRVQVGLFVSGEGIYGVAAATLRLIATGAVGDTAAFAAGTATGRMSPFDFGAATNAIFATAGGWRIDAAGDPDNNSTAAGFTFHQRDPATAAPGTFSTANPALVFRFDVTIGADAQDRVISMTLDQLTRGLAGYYADAQAQLVSRVVPTLNGGTITVPAPGAIGMLAGAGVFAARRRRAGLV